MIEASQKVIDGGSAGQTLAAVVRSLYEGMPWSKARELCETGRVSVDDCVVSDSAFRVLAGTTIHVNPQAKKARTGVLSADSIVYFDRDVVVVRKPPGVLTLPYEHGDRDTLVDLTRGLLKRLQKGVKKYDPELGVVQRLDKDTSGILVFTRTLDAKKHLQQQLRVHSVERMYLAIVHGIASDATYESSFIRDRGDGLRGSWGVFRKPKTKTPPEDSQRALTRVTHIDTLRGASLVACQLETGRQHQIRIHLSEAGHVLVGETVYVREQRGARIEAPRIMLHATRLGFEHPRTGETMTFEDEPPEDFRAMLASLRGPEKPAS